jgi:hypothetical protein
MKPFVSASLDQANTSILIGEEAPRRFAVDAVNFTTAAFDGVCAITPVWK